MYSPFNDNATYPDSVKPYQPLSLDYVKGLPDQTYWTAHEKGDFDNSAMMQWMRQDSPYQSANLMRHYFVNGIPLYFLSMRRVLPNPRHYRDPFCTMEQCLSKILHGKEEGEIYSSIVMHDIRELNQLHVTYEDGERQVQDYTNWMYHFDDRYESGARLIFSGLTEEHQEKFLPKETREILTRPLED